MPPPRIRKNIGRLRVRTQDVRTGSQLACLPRSAEVLTVLAATSIAVLRTKRTFARGKLAMKTYRPQPIDVTKILSRRELAAVLNDLKRKPLRSKNTRMNLVLFRLACCCGLRASEIAKLQVGDGAPSWRAHIRIRTGALKGGRPRMVPLWWDAGTLEDLSAWKIDRVRSGAEHNEPFLASLVPGRPVKTFSRHTLRKRFRTACKILGLPRLESLTIHHGRHTFISHALAGRRTLAEVRDAAGHANVSITSGYLHVAVDDEAVGDLFQRDIADR